MPCQPPKVPQKPITVVRRSRSEPRIAPAFGGRSRRVHLPDRPRSIPREDLLRGRCRAAGRGRSLMCFYTTIDEGAWARKREVLDPQKVPSSYIQPVEPKLRPCGRLGRCTGDVGDAELHWHERAPRNFLDHAFMGRRRPGARLRKRREGRVVVAVRANDVEARSRARPGWEQYLAEAGRRAWRKLMGRARACRRVRRPSLAPRGRWLVGSRRTRTSPSRAASDAGPETRPLSGDGEAEAATSRGGSGLAVQWSPRAPAVDRIKSRAERAATRRWRAASRGIDEFVLIASLGR